MCSVVRSGICSQRRVKESLLGSHSGRKLRVLSASTIVNSRNQSISGISTTQAALNPITQVSSLDAGLKTSEEQKPVHRPFRAVKSPRDILLNDTANKLETNFCHMCHLVRHLSFYNLQPHNSIQLNSTH
jgi:hypothetical protein